MPTPTYTPLANVTLGTASTSVTFSSIPATYRDLILVLQTTNATNSFAFLRFNGDSGSNYNHVVMFNGGNESGANLAQAYIGTTSGTYQSIVKSQILDYSATDKHKSMVSRSDAAQGLVGASSARWANTSAITSMLVGVASGIFPVGSTFALYGVIA
jgi:hypothetical protein